MQLRKQLKYYLGLERNVGAASSAVFLQRFLEKLEGKTKA
jgi:hypothetical protein